MSEKSGLEKSLSALQTDEGRLALAEDENASSACFSPRPALFPLSTEGVARRTPAYFAACRVRGNILRYRPGRKNAWF